MNKKHITKDRASLIIVGDKAYINRMFLHLRKEHPSTKKRMKKQ